MNITSTARTVIDHHVVLSDDELGRIKTESPTFAALLEHAHVANGQTKPNQTKPNQTKPKTRRRRATVKRSSKVAAKQSAPKASQLRQCPQCPKTFKTQGRLERHLRQAHSDDQATADAAT